MLIRSILVVAFIAALWALGVLHLEDLPLESQEFQVCGITVLVYLLWSGAEANRGRGSAGMPYMIFYAVLLVSAVDSFLLELTSGILPYSIRWLGLLLFLTGSVCRIVAFRKNCRELLRWGRYLQLLGLPSALGSVAGLALAVLVGIPGSAGEEMPEQVDSDWEDS